MNSPLIIIMGVSGCGKTTIGSNLADQIGGVYLEGDAFHPPENKEKMGNAIALTDEDRWPWFDQLIAESQKVIENGQTAVLACSALKKEYRDYLFRHFPHHRLVFLEGSFETIKARMDARDHEYMTSSLLESQFATLEAPESAERPIEVSITLAPDEIIREITMLLENE